MPCIVFVLMRSTSFILIAILAFTAPAFAMKLTVEGNVISVDCRIGESHESCLLDTGAGHSSLRSNFDMGQWVRLKDVKSKAARHENSNCALYRVPHFSALSRDVGDFEMQKCESDDDLGNVIGLSFLKQPFVLDFPGQDFRWEKAPEKTDLQPLKVMPQGHLILNAVATANHVGILFDTGSAYSAVDYQYATEHPDAFEFVGLSQNIQIDANGHPFRAFLFRAVYLNVGGRDLSGRVFRSWNFGDLRDYLGADVPLILGLNDMIGARWSFDVDSRRWAVW